MPYRGKVALINRFEGNPVLTRDDVPYPVSTVHNAAVVKYEGRYIMIFRSHLYNGRSILGLAESDDGFHFRVSGKPFLTPSETGFLENMKNMG